MKTLKRIKRYTSGGANPSKSLLPILYYCVKRRERKGKLEKKYPPLPLKKSHLSGKKGNYPLKIMVVGEKIYIKE